MTAGPVQAAPEIDRARLRVHLGWSTDPQVRLQPATPGRWRYAISGERDLEVRRATDHAFDVASGLEDEVRLQQRVGQMGLPVPEVLGLSRDTAVVGAPFAVTDRPRGHRIHQRLPAGYPRTPTTRHDVSAALIDLMVRLHELDWQRLELPAPDVGRLELQLMAWRRAWNALSSRRVVEMGELHRRLAAAIPPLSGWALLHNDFHLGNAIYAPDDPSTIVALANWELAGAGDPLSDLGYLWACWPEQPDDPVVLAQGVSLTCDDGFFSRSTVVHEYFARTRCDLVALPWHIAFGYMRLAVTTEWHRLQAMGPEPRVDDDPVVLLLRRGLAEIGT